MQWQPIDSAPKGETILVACPQWHIFAAVIRSSGVVITVPGGYDRSDATHWQPLPPPPEPTDAT